MALLEQRNPHSHLRQVNKKALVSGDLVRMVREKIQQKKGATFGGKSRPFRYVPSV
jgi:hypothetical protein